MKWKILFLLTFLLYLTASEPIVQLPAGQILGREATTLENNLYYAFEGIPYASPPVGPLRFKAPQPAEPWEGVLDVTHYETTCYQISGNTEQESEDCLHLNIFTPQLPTKGNEPLPVMIYIYGGAFINGQTQGFYPDLFVNKGVILVTISYRLGIFGFLSTLDETLPGNYGLKDQQFAIQWTHDNIHLFGGDPNKITLFGQSAGSASVTYQLLNQKNEGLFQGVILQSGSFLSPWAYQRRAHEIAFGTAALLNSSFQGSTDSAALLNFLQTVDAKNLDAAQEQYESAGWVNGKLETFQGFFWTPVIEPDGPDAFFTEKMYGLLLSGNILKVPAIIGINSEEGLTLFSDATSLGQWLLLFDQNLNWLVPDDMQIEGASELVEMGRSIREIYTGEEALADHIGDGVRYCSDNFITRSVIKFAEIYSQISTTYFYQFSFNGPLGNNNVHYDGADGVTHSQEIPYFYCSGTYCDIGNYPEGDRNTRERLVTMWTNFAKYRNPTPEVNDLFQNITWPLLDTSGGNYYYLDINENLEVKNHPKEDAYKGWTALYDSLGYNSFDTY